MRGRQCELLGFAVRSRCAGSAFSSASSHRFASSVSGVWGTAAARHGTALGALHMGRLAESRCSLWFGAIRFAASKARQQGTVKMWNEERGFGFLTPAGGGEDVFCHRSSLAEGVQLAPGVHVSYEAEWDDKKKKDRAMDVKISDSAPQDQPPAQESSRPARESREAAGRASTPTPQPAGPAPRSHHIAGTFGKWAVHRDPMTPDGPGGALRHRITIRAEATKFDGDKRREEFQIVGDGSWEKRVYPAGYDKEECVVLRPGTRSPTASERGKGHGRNWGVEGKAGTVFDVMYNPAEQWVVCEVVS